jgi:hypothetical protein
VACAAARTWLCPWVCSGCGVSGTSRMHRHGSMRDWAVSQGPRLGLPEVSRSASGVLAGYRASTGSLGTVSQFGAGHCVALVGPCFLFPDLCPVAHSSTRWEHGFWDPRMLHSFGASLGGAVVALKCPLPLAVSSAGFCVEGPGGGSG